MVTSRCLLAFCLIGSLTLSAQAQTLSQRQTAASTTAKSHPACAALPAFYWEIGDAKGRLAGGSRGLFAPGASTVMPVYSAGKWMYGAYVHERRGGVLEAVDQQALTMGSGYTASGLCTLDATVGACGSRLSAFDASAVGLFHYAPGHFQRHAAVHMGLGAMSKAQLAAEMRKVLGSDIALSYAEPKLAGGMKTSARDFAVFLRKTLKGELRLSGGALGSASVCTYAGPSDPQTGRLNCPTSKSSPAGSAPGSTPEALEYASGHWVESDPVVGDGAYSSPGAAGFYPWIDASRTWYGLIARNSLTLTAAGESMRCGRVIRQAWATGAVPGN